MVYINGDNTPATQVLAPVLDAIPTAKTQHDRNTDTNGNTTTDTILPKITVPSDIVVEATSEEGAQVTYTVTAQDNLDGTATLEEDGTVTQDDVGCSIKISCSDPPGSLFGVGDTAVECSATDTADNRGGPVSFTVTVNPPATVDTIPPFISVPDDIAVEATSTDGATVSFEVSAEDNVDGAVDLSCDYNSGDTFSIGETVVTCTAEDSAGNRAEETFTITVQPPREEEQQAREEPPANNTEA